VSYFALNLLLAILWIFLWGQFTFPAFVVGLVVGFAAIAFSRAVLGSERYVRSVFGTVRLVLGFLRELVLANVQLARDILRPVPPFRPGFIAFDIRDLGPTETVFLSNLVSLTPGTLTVDSDDDGYTLYIHSVYAEDPEETRRSIRRLANLVHGALGQDPLYPPNSESR
jgi:multicomponent Na+:H+ antiporter subunit E